MGTEQSLEYGVDHAVKAGKKRNVPFSDSASDTYLTQPTQRKSSCQFGETTVRSENWPANCRHGPNVWRGGFLASLTESQGGSPLRKPTAFSFRWLE
jgi:hypothetical protein